MGNQRVIASEPIIKEVSLTLDNNTQYASGDLLADTQEIASVCVGGRPVILYSIRLLDKDDQGGELDLLFLESNTDMGTENSAFAPSDASAAAILTSVNITSYTDFANSQLATKNVDDAGMGVLLKPSDGSSLYIAAISRDTKTYTTAGGIELHIGFIRP